MEKSSFFNSIDGDRKYKAEEWAEYFASLIGNGVFPEPSTNLMVEAYNNMTIKVKAGKAWINGYFYFNTADLTVQLENADGVLKRIDRIVIRWSLTNRSIQAAVKKGTFASSPVAPALQRDADIYEIALADVLVNNGVIEVTQANITDLRQNSSLCGIVAGTVDQIDASGLFAQYEQIFNTWMTSSDQEYATWFDSIQSILDENVAANLLNLINANTDLINAHKSDYVAQPANGGTTSGTATAYTCTSTPAPASLVEKIGVIITAHVDSGSNPTLNWNSKGAKPIKKPNGNAAVLKSGGVYTLRYNATTENFILQGEGASGNAIASDLLSGKTASTDAGDIVGTMVDRGAVNHSLAINGSYTIPAGKHNGSGAVTQSIPTKAAQTFTPSTVNQTIAAGQYLTGAQTIAGDADLIASNIKAGVNIFGVLGTLLDGTNMKKYATGTLTTPATTTNFRTSDGVLRGYYKAEVTGLTFKPRIVFFFDTGGFNSFTFCYDPARFFGNDALVRAVMIDGMNADAFVRNTDGYSVTNGGFVLPHRNISAPITWFAFE